jgi:hypothetical protein
MDQGNLGMRNTQGLDQMLDRSPACKTVTENFLAAKGWEEIAQFSEKAEDNLAHSLDSSYGALPESPNAFKPSASFPPSRQQSSDWLPGQR